MEKELKQKVDEVKASGLSVFSVKINSRPFVYRAINRREFRQLQLEIADMAEKVKQKFSTNEAEMNSQLSLIKEKGEEKLVVLSLLDPKLELETDTDQIPAGAVTRIADLVMRASGFDDAEPDEPEQL